MKIIKQGKKPDPKVVRFECNECGSVFEENVEKCNMLCCFGDGPVYDIECPTCGKKVKSDKILTSSGEMEDSTAIPPGIKARGEKVRLLRRFYEARTRVVREEGEEKALTDWQRADLLNDIADLHGKVPEKAEQMLRDAVEAAWIGDIAKARELTSKAVALAYLGG